MNSVRSISRQAELITLDSVGCGHYAYSSSNKINVSEAHTVKNIFGFFCSFFISSAIQSIVLTIDNSQKENNERKKKEKKGG